MRPMPLVLYAKSTPETETLLTPTVGLGQNNFDAEWAGLVRVVKS